MQFVFTVLALVFCLQINSQFGAVDARRNVRTLLGVTEDDIKIDWKNEVLRRLRRSPEKSDTGAGDDSDEDDEDTTKPPDETKPSKKKNPSQFYLPENYNKLEIPRSSFLSDDDEEEDEITQTEVTLQLNIRSIAEINEAEDEIEFEMDITVEWFDYGLLSAVFDKVGEGDFDQFDALFNQEQKVLDSSFLKKIWKPDIFIEDLVSVTSPDLMGKPAKLLFSPSGLVTYTARVKVTLECDYDFLYYPADTQTCYVVFRSFSHNSTVLDLKWRPPIGVYLLFPDDDNFDVAVGGLRRFRLITHGDHDLKSNETFDCLEFTILARRRLSYHLVQTYIPSMLYIAITWLCFMVPRRMIEARMAIVMTTLLTLTAMFASVRESTPVVSYTKAIDVWMVACITFVFLVLLEFSVLLWTESQNNAEEEKQKTKDGSEELEMELVDSGSKKVRDDHSIKQPPTATAGQRIRTCVLKKATVAINFIEAYLFILILSIFVIFNVLYWSWLLSISGYYDWTVNATHNAVGVLKSERELKELTPFAELKAGPFA